MLEIGAVTENEWGVIVNGLHQEYLKLVSHINEEQEHSSMKANVLMTELAHAAYHLGAIRQMVKVIE